MAQDTQNATEEPGFFDGRFMIEIGEWNWELYVGMGNARTPRRYLFQGGLNFSRWLDIHGRVRAPAAHRGKSCRVAISAFGPEVRFGGKKGLKSVGQFERSPSEGPKVDFRAHLMLPEQSIEPTILCLSSAWKFLDVWVDKDADQAAVTAFSFSAAIHPNLTDWAGLPLEETDSRLGSRPSPG